MIEIRADGGWRGWQALVEYLKSNPEEPGRITPFGGLPQPEMTALR